MKLGMKILAGLLAAGSLLMLASCGKSSVISDNMVAERAASDGNGKSQPTITVGMPPGAVTRTVAPKTYDTTGYSGDTSTTQYNSAATITVDRMIVRTGNMSIVVEDVTAAIEKISALSETGQGYVVSANTWRDGERLYGNITIRVPSGDFNKVMQQISGLAVEVTSQSSTSQDVTEEYVDLTAKLKTLEATEQQLLVIMGKAEKVEDILAVQKQLTDIQTQIEQTKGRMQYLEKTTAMSLINISLEQSKLDVTFSADGRFIKSGVSVRFNPTIGGGFAPYSYQWDFGDGKTSNEEYPVHTYRASGEYTVKLTVTDDRGNTANETMQDYINVAAGWSAGNIASNAWSGLAAFGRALVNIVIWLGIFSPVWIIAGIIIFLVVRRRKKSR
jgi:PKD repeat protein